MLAMNYPITMERFGRPEGPCWLLQYIFNWDYSPWLILSNEEFDKVDNGINLLHRRRREVCNKHCEAINRKKGTKRRDVILRNNMFSVNKFSDYYAVQLFVCNCTNRLTKALFCDREFLQRYMCIKNSTIWSHSQSLTGWCKFQMQ